MIKLANILLRGLTLSSKFLLVFYLAKFLEPSELGLYGLISATIGYALYVLGLEFYTFSTREFIKTPATEWGNYLKAQIYLTLIIYIVFLPALSLIFTFKVLPLSYLGWFYLLLIFEHLTQELNRIFIAISKPFLASVILFIRSALWILFVIPFMYKFESTRDLNHVFLFWAGGGIMAFTFSALILSRRKLGGWEKPVDWVWIKKGLKVALPFLISALAIRGIFTLDRYFLDNYMSLHAVAAYVLFVSMANAMISFLDSGVFVFLYPELISAHANGHKQLFNQIMKKLTLQVVLTTASFSFLAGFGVNIVLQLLNRPEYLDQSWQFKWIMMAMSCYSIGLVPQYGLYALGRDKEIIYGHFMSFIVFIITTILIAQFNPLWSVIIGLIVSLGLGAFWNYWFYQKYISKVSPNS
ncbi:MAG: hypothetical protein ACK41T_02990 [Pseudobdellovibrio sp.]